MSSSAHTTESKRPVADRALALAILVALVGAAAVSLLGPLIEAANERARAADRLARFEAALAEPAPELRQYDPDELAAVRQNDGEAQIALQLILDRMFREAGVSVQAIRPLRAEQMGETGRAVWVEATLSGDLQSFVDLLNAMDALRPTLLVRRLELGRGGPAVSRALSIRMEAGQAWRAGATEQ